MDYNEKLSGKTPLRPKDARRETDEAYKNMIETLDGLIHLEGIEEYAGFVSELNILIKHYNDQVALHLGRIQAAKEREKEKEK
jgi:hypothetical protein